MSQDRDDAPDGWQLNAGPDDHITPRDLYRAMLIARSMNEHGMAERLRLALQDAFLAAGVPIPPDAQAVRPALH